MKNRVIERLREVYFSIEKFLGNNRSSMWLMVIGELSYMEGYIKGLEYSVEQLKIKLEKAGG